MEKKLWHQERWPEGVPYDIDGYQKPLFSLLDDSARDFPDADFTVFQGASRTFSQVRDTADRIANFLSIRGIRKGDRVAVFLPNIPHYIPIFFGILKAGAACVTCNPLYTATELNFQLKDSGAKAVFVMDHPTFYGTATKAVEDTDVKTMVICNIKSYLPFIKGFLGGLLGKIPKAESHRPEDFMFDAVVKNTQPQTPALQIDANKDLALVLYTGGTTGVPKGAALSHTSLTYDAMACCEWVRLSPGNGEPARALERGGVHTFLGVLPWYHSFGLTLCMLLSTLTASRLVCIPDPKAGDPPLTIILESIQTYKATVVVAVPTIFTAVVNHPLLDKFDLTSVWGCGSGAAPLPLEIIKKFEERTGSVIFEGYGLTETSPVASINPTNVEGRKVGSVGMPLPGTDVKIVDLDTGTQELATGEDGEIAICGPQVMQGYWQKPEEDEHVFRQIDGRRFFLSGDIGHFDEDGFIFITDRKKDLILVGGFNVYPREVEEVLFTHPKVAQAAVVGVPDERSGEAVVAFVQLLAGEEATEEEFKAFCKDKMAGYKRPRRIEFRENLPTSVVGKVLRRVLRDEELKKQASSA